MISLSRDDIWVAIVAVSGGLGSVSLRDRTAMDCRIVVDALEAGGSVARVDLERGVNANEVFQRPELKLLN